MTEAATSDPAVPEVTERATWQARIDELRVVVTDQGRTHRRPRYRRPLTMWSSAVTKEE